MSTERLKHLVDIRISTVDKKTAEGQTPVALCNYTDVYYNDRIVTEMPMMVATATAEQIAKFTLRAGDVLITKDSETADDIAVPAFVPADLPGVLSGYHLAILRPLPDRIDGKYLYWAVSANPVRDQFTLAASGVTRFGLRYDRVADATVPVPPMDRQRAIADYLDRETAEIDRIIRQKEHLLALLRERRAGLVDRRILHGQPGVREVPTGIGWWPAAPAGWDVRRLSTTITECRNGIWGTDPIGGPDDIACVRVADFDREASVVRGGELTRRTIEPWQRARHRLSPGDLLLEKSGGGERQPVGKVVLFDRDDEAVCSNFVARMPVAPGHHPSYLRHLHATLYGRRINVRSIKQSTGIQNLDSDAYLAEKVAIPPLADQAALAAGLDEQVAASLGAAASIRGQMDLLRERRAALVTAAVTGGLSLTAITGQEVAGAAG